MQEKDQALGIPTTQKMERQESLARGHSEEYKAALQRAVTLSVPHARMPSEYGTFDEQEEDNSDHSTSSSAGRSSSGTSKRNTKEGWGDLMDRLLDKDAAGHFIPWKSQAGEK